MRPPVPPARPTSPKQATDRIGEVRYDPDSGLVWWDGAKWTDVPSSAFSLMARNTDAVEGSPDHDLRT